MQPTPGHFHRHAPTTADSAESCSERIMAWITRKVGTLACAIVFCGIALISLPAALASGSLIVIVSWVAQTLLQLVLLSIILGGQGVAEKAADAQTAHMALGIDTTLDQLNPVSPGGLQVVVDRIETLGASVAELHGRLDDTTLDPKPKPKRSGRAPSE